MLSYVKGFVSEVICFIFLLVLKLAFFAIVMWFWGVPFFPLHVVSLAFDLDMWRVSGKNSGSGELEQEKQLRISVLRHVFNTYAFPSTMELETQLRSLAILVFSLHIRVSMFLWQHIPNIEILEHHVYRCGNTSITHMFLQSLFMSLCGSTYVFTYSGSVKSKKHMRVWLFASLNNKEAHSRSTPTFSHLL